MGGFPVRSLNRAIASDIRLNSGKKGDSNQRDVYKQQGKFNSLPTIPSLITSSNGTVGHVRWQVCSGTEIEQPPTCTIIISVNLFRFRYQRGTVDKHT
jgi:hypothetical protein